MSHLTSLRAYLFLKAELDADAFLAAKEHLGRCEICTELCGHMSDALRATGYLLPAARRYRRAAAALLLMTLSSLATGAVFYQWIRPALVATDERPGQSVESLQRSRRWDLDRASLAEEGSRYYGHAEFIDESGGVAAAAAFGLPEGLDVCGFAADGEFLWSLRQSWSDWEEVLGRPDLKLENLRSLVSRQTDGSLEETICVVVRRGAESCILFVDPTTGAARHYIYRGIVGRDKRGLIRLSVLPSSVGTPRNVVVSGSYGTQETASPALLVLRLDGTLVQDIRFPTIGPPSQIIADHLLVDWHGKPPLTRVQLTDNIHYLFAVRGGRLQDPIARGSDSLSVVFDQWRGPGAWAQKMREEGGLEDFLKKHVQGIREVPGPSTSRRWRDR